MASTSPVRHPRRRQCAIRAAAMPPLTALTCSLLALGALIIAANAKITHVDLGLGGKCVKFIIDVPPRPVPYQPIDHGFRFTMMTDGNSQALKIIPNKCKAYNRNEEISKQTVEVCNDYPHSEHGLLPPKVRTLGDNFLSPIYASCGDDTECGPLFWKIEQDCRHSVQ